MRSKYCCKCGDEIEITRIGKQSYCRKCHAAHMRKSRKPHNKLSAKEKSRHAARSRIRMYMSRNKLAKPPCEICGNPKTEAHHPDYKKPCEVNWLCKQHHKEHHKRPFTLNDPVFYGRNGIKNGSTGKENNSQ